jgi:oligopeptidase B
MRDKDRPEMREYLAAERAWYDGQTAPQRGLREELFAELAGRLVPAEESARWRQGLSWYFTRTVAGQQLEQFCRAADPGGADPGGPVEVLLDGNVLLDDPACTGSYAELGVREVSPDGRYLAYSVDFAGDEVYQLRVRDLATGLDLAERIEGTYYGLAWAADSRALLYVVTDAAYRPHQVWRHELGTAPDQDTLVYREDDERFELTVRATRSGAWLLIEAASRDTTETLMIPAGDIRAEPFVAEKRKPGTEYYADHADGPGGGELYLVTNAGAAEFRLVRAPVTAPGRAAWTEVIGPAADTRLVRCDVFGRYLVVEQRRGAATQLRVVDRETGAWHLIGAGGPERSLALAVNEEYAAAAVTVRTESLTEPPSWHDVDLATGRWELRKRQQVPGYDPAAYVTERISAPAGDGTLIPVTVAYRRGLRRDGSAPALLYGYGAYEACSWPEFGAGVPSLLDRGFVYAVAHVRGGGEGGRRWWAEGHLDRKRTTFTDFIAAADMLASAGWAPYHSVGRRAAPGRRVLAGPGPVAGGGGRGPVRGRGDHHARPDHPADRQRVGRVG